MAFIESTCSQGTYYPPAHSEPLGNILFVVFERKEVVKKKKSKEIRMSILKSNIDQTTVF